MHYKDTVDAMSDSDECVPEVINVGTNEGTDATAHPHIAIEGAYLIADGKADLGIFVCGTGMGVAIAADNVPGIRASTARTPRVVVRRRGGGSRMGLLANE